MPKDKKLFSKIVVITLLVLMVLGFSVPLFNLGGGKSTDPTKKAEPRVCQTDSDCYLVCNDKPLNILCSQNLCLQNSCDEYSLYPFQETPLKFKLNVELAGQKMDLPARMDSKDLMVKFDAGEVRVFSWGLPLNFILEKVDLSLNEQCLKVDGTEYCSKEKLKFMLNGNETLPNPSYYPKEGDTIKIKYS